MVEVPDGSASLPAPPAYVSIDAIVRNSPFSFNCSDIQNTIFALLTGAYSLSARMKVALSGYSSIQAMGGHVLAELSLDDSDTIVLTTSMLTDPSFDMSDYLDAFLVPDSFSFTIKAYGDPKEEVSSSLCLFAFRFRPGGFFIFAFSSESEQAAAYAPQNVGCLGYIVCSGNQNKLL